MIQDTIDRFIQQHVDLSKPLLVGLSGGPDSLALLHALLETKAVKIGVAHLDHGWRKESGQEADALRLQVEALALPFHVKKMGSVSGNLEEACREERRSFFMELCKQHGYQAVALGHHANDQAETVLKRLFEGASLAHLKGMDATTMYLMPEGTLTIFRPLLTVFRKDIDAYIKEKGLTPFIDPTNRETKFLRARMREELLPFLSDAFGKNIAKGLMHVSSETGELQEYLDRKIAPFFPRTTKGPFGLMIEFVGGVPKEGVERGYLLRKVVEQHAKLSKSQYVTLSDLLESGAANRRILSGKATLIVDRGTLFILNDEEKGEWTMESKEGGPPLPFPNWREVWEGKIVCTLPRGDYSLATYNKKDLYPRSHSIDKWWTAHKVPFFMRALVPVVMQEGKIFHEFLTGKGVCRPEKSETLTLSLRRIPHMIK